MQYLKQYAAIFHQQRKMQMSMNRTHDHYLYNEKYNLGEPGTGFLITPTFV